MAITAPKSGKNFAPAAEGVQAGVIAKVVDLGLVEKTYQGQTTKKPMIQILWQVAEKDEAGEPKRVSEFFTLSLHEKAKLRKRMINLFGTVPPADFDFEKLLGTNRNLVLVHSKSADGSRTYANIETTMKLNPGQKKLDIVPFELKKKDEVKAVQPLTGARPVTEADPIDDSDLPF